MPAITRAELAGHIEAAFTGGPATRADLLAAATSSHARTQAIEQLHRLPDRTYRDLREIWYDLPELPVSN